MSAFWRIINGAVGLIGRLVVWLAYGRKDSSVTLTLDANQQALAANLKSIIGAMSAIGGQAQKVWNDVVAAAKVKFGDGWQDVIAVNDLLLLIADVIAGAGNIVPNPASAAAQTFVTVDQLALTALPQLQAAAQMLDAFLGVAKTFAGVHIQGAIPGASPMDGGYPQGPNTGRAHIAGT